MSSRPDTVASRDLQARTGAILDLAKREPGTVTGSTSANWLPSLPYGLWVGVDAKALTILPNQRQTGVGGEIVGEFFDNKVGHVVLTFCVNTILHLSR